LARQNVSSFARNYPSGTIRAFQLQIAEGIKAPIEVFKSRITSHPDEPGLCPVLSKNVLEADQLLGALSMHGTVLIVQRKEE
jgi:hypothetical protein